MQQKFKRGDLVHITADMPSYMSHFKSDLDAIVLGSYADQFGGSCIDEYTLLLIKDGKWYNESSWYEENQLTFIRHEGEEYIQKLQAEKDGLDKIHSDLDWIIDNWHTFKEEIPSASAQKLMALIGITNPFGNHGEYIDYYNHWLFTLEIITPIMETGDKQKIKEFFRDFPKINEFIVSSDLYHGDNEFREPKI
jgi:hypothetical protein